MNSLIQADLHQPLITQQADNKHAAEIDHAPPPAERLQRACTNPDNILGVSLFAALGSAAVLGVGTGTGKPEYLIAGGAGLATGAVSALAVLLRNPETYTFATGLGDRCATTIAATMASAMVWFLATIVSFPGDLPPI